MQCDEKFDNFSSCNSHRKHHKDSISITQPEPERHICSDCGKIFVSSRLLTRHIYKIHKEGKRSNCDICDKKFRDNYGLKRHLKEGHKIAEESQDIPDGNQDDPVDDETSTRLKEVKSKNQCPLCGKHRVKLNRH